MDESYNAQQVFSDVNTRIRDIEEKQRLMNERVILTGKSLIDERDRNFKELQTLKKTVSDIKEEVRKISEFLQRVSEQLSNVARKEELMILQRQLDIFREQ